MSDRSVTLGGWWHSFGPVVQLLTLLGVVLKVLLVLSVLLVLTLLTGRCAASVA